MSKPRIVRIRGEWCVGRWRWFGLTGHKFFVVDGSGRTIREAWESAFPSSRWRRLLARLSRARTRFAEEGHA